MESSGPDFNFIHLDTVNSTNSYLIDLLSKTSPTDGFCVFSDFQTEGRGQYGRIWQSYPAVNILASFAYRTSWLEEKQVFCLNQISALAVLGVLQDYLPGEDIVIKWPNDILCNRKKIAGILIQNIFRGSQMQWSVVGIGLNVNQTDFDPSLIATSMRQVAGLNFDRMLLLRALHDRLNHLMALKSGDRNFDLLDDYNASLFGHGQKVLLEKTGGIRFEAVLLGVDESGNLRMNVDGRFQSMDWSMVRIILPAG